MIVIDHFDETNAVRGLKEDPLLKTIRSGNALKNGLGTKKIETPVLIW